MTQTQSFIDVVSRSSPSIGGVCKIPSAFSAELMALAGYDFVMIDVQHGLIDYASMCTMILGLDRHGVPSVVRVAWNDPPAIMRALDAGAQGVIVPMVEGPADAQRAAGASHYPPGGYRSLGPVRAALGDPSFTPAAANARVACVPMIETAEALRQIREIVETPGIAAVYVGPWDLSLATTGHLDEVGRKDSDREAYAAVIRACRDRGLPAGVACASAEDARDRIEEGFAFVTVGSDSSLLSASARAEVSEVRTRVARTPDGS